MVNRRKTLKHAKETLAASYRHPESENLIRPQVETLARFKKKLPRRKYRYDDSLSPPLERDRQNLARARRGHLHRKSELRTREVRPDAVFAMR
jgi:hypothetical protein